jgi:heptaprenyl diphosphate synthase
MVIIMTMQNKCKKISYIAIFSAFSLTMFLIDNLFSPLFPLPYFKLGLSQLVILISLFYLDFDGSLLVLINKCLIGTFITGNLFSLIFSFSSGLISLILMYLLLKFCFPYLNIVIISLISSIIYNVVEVIVACFVLQNYYLINTLPYFCIIGSITGILIGIVAHITLKKI